ncbi:MAG TPA: hypothetical protein VF381_05170 [Thermoanaerobaculia bacterium]
MVVFDSRRVIVRARRMAIARDVAQVMLLAGVDWLFQNWPSTHFPLLQRGDSLVLLGIVNVATIAHVWACRAFPRWRARRISETWSAHERERLMSSVSVSRRG